METIVQSILWLPRTIAAAFTAAALITAVACGDGPRTHGDFPVQQLPEFGAPETPSAVTGVGRAPAYAISPDGAEVMAWVSAPDGGTDGRLQVMRGTRVVEVKDALGPIEAHDEAPPKIVFGSDSSSLFLLYVVARVEEGKRFPAGALRFVTSADGGATWSRAVTVTDDGDFGSHNFHAMHAGRDGALYVSWLDGRNGVSNVYIARSTDSGKTWQKNQRVYEGEACPCCRTAMATDAKGNLYLSWRTVMPGNIRDIVVARSSDGGSSWSEPKRVHADNWVFPGCPHAGPVIHSDDHGRLHISWWTGLEGKAGVYYAHSDDAGETWSKPIDMTVAAFSRPASIDMAFASNNRVLITWCDGTVETPVVRLRVSADGGNTFGDRMDISDSSRHAFFPVLGVRDSLVTILWSEQTRQFAHDEAAAHPDMSHPDSKKGLSKVGQTSVVLRRGILR
jgi:hypothetical protein